MATRTFRPGLFSALLACMSLASLAPLLVLEGSRFEGINGEVADHHDAELLQAASSMARETLSVVEGHRRATETLALSVSLQHQPLEQLQRQQTLRCAQRSSPRWPRARVRAPPAPR